MKKLYFLMIAAMAAVFTSCEDDQDEQHVKYSVVVNYETLPGTQDFSTYLVQAGTTYRAKVNITINVDNSESNTNAYFERVEMYWDDILVEKSNSDTFTFTYDIPLGTEGSHVLKAKVFTATHGVGTWTPQESNMYVIVAKDSPVLGIEFNSPDIVTNNIPFTCEAVQTAFSNVGNVYKVVFATDDNAIGTLNAPPFKMSNTVNGISEGVHTLSAYFYFEGYEKDYRFWYRLSKPVIIKL